MTPFEQYKQEGYYIVKNAFDTEAIGKVYTEARKIFAAQIKRVTGATPDIDDKNAFENAMFDFFEKDFEGFANTGKTVQHGMDLHQLGASSQATQLLKDFGIAQPVIAVRPAVQFNSRFLSKNGSKHWRMDAHQDWRAGQGSLDSVVMWFPLVSCGQDLGALQVVPGSHKWGLLNANHVGYDGDLVAEIDENSFVQTEFEVGDVLLFSAFLVHRSGTNTTNNIRWSVQFRYNNLEEPTFIERGFPMPYIYKANNDIVTPDFPTVQQVIQTYA
jgi:phytanoyl-CoA hydroxylase